MVELSFESYTVCGEGLCHFRRDMLVSSVRIDPQYRGHFLPVRAVRQRRMRAREEYDPCEVLQNILPSLLAMCNGDGLSGSINAPSV